MNLSANTKRWLVPAAILVAAGALVAAVLIYGSRQSSPTASPSPAAVEAGAIIELSDTGFLPGTITVKAGTLVQWNNNSSTNRKIVTNSSPANATMAAEVSIGAHKSYSVRFNEAGTYNYYDSVHPAANNQVVVTP